MYSLFFLICTFCILGFVILGGICNLNDVKNQRKCNIKPDGLGFKCNLDIAVLCPNCNPAASNLGWNCNVEAVGLYVICNPEPAGLCAICILWCALCHLGKANFSLYQKFIVSQHRQVIFLQTSHFPAPFLNLINQISRQCHRILITGTAAYLRPARQQIYEKT